MAINLDWFTGLETAFTSLFSAVASAGAVWLAMRRKISSDTTGIAEDKLARGMLETMRKERESAIAEARDAWKIMLAERDRAVADAKEAWAARMDDAKKIVTLEQQLKSVDEKYMVLTQELLSMRLRSQKLIAIVAKLDPTAAQLLALESEEAKKVTV